MTDETIEDIVSHQGYHKCGCGIPRRARFYVHMVIDRDVPGGTETSYVDWYTCAHHIDRKRPERLLHPDITKQGWRVLESTVTELRGSTA